MKLKEKFDNAKVITTELGPVKGVFTYESIQKARGYDSLDGINIHDCPMGNLRINSIAMGSLVQQHLGVPAIPHFTCRDRSLLGTQADLLGAHALGIRHILVTTGDPPKHGPYPSKAVYDCNTFDLVRLIKKLNQGLDYNDKEFGGQTDFMVSCTASPASRDLDREIGRMEKKIAAGADFFQTQVVYDAEKTLAFLEKTRPLNVPVIVGIMPLKSAKMARFMDRNVDGIDVPQAVIARMEEGASGIDIARDFIARIIDTADGIHIMAMGNVDGTNELVSFIRSKTA